MTQNGDGITGKRELETGERKRRVGKKEEKGDGVGGRGNGKCGKASKGRKGLLLSHKKGDEFLKNISSPEGASCRKGLKSYIPWGEGLKELSCYVWHRMYI